MFALPFVVACTIAGMTVLVIFSRRLFEENRTRVVRHPPAPARRPDDAQPDIIWRTLVPAPVVSQRR